MAAVPGAGLSGYLRIDGDDVLLAIRAQPGARAAGLDGVVEGPEGRRRSVEQVKEFQRRFTQQFHLLNCRELLAERGLHPTPTAQAVGADDHCGTLIVSAVELLCDYLAELDGQK